MYCKINLLYFSDDKNVARGFNRATKSVQHHPMIRHTCQKVFAVDVEVASLSITAAAAAAGLQETNAKKTG